MLFTRGILPLGIVKPAHVVEQWCTQLNSSLPAFKTPTHLKDEHWLCFAAYLQLRRVKSIYHDSLYKKVVTDNQDVWERVSQNLPADLQLSPLSKELVTAVRERSGGVGKARYIMDLVDKYECLLEQQNKVHKRNNSTLTKDATNYWRILNSRQSRKIKHLSRDWLVAVGHAIDEEKVSFDEGITLALLLDDLEVLMLNTPKHRKNYNVWVRMAEDLEKEEETGEEVKGEVKEGATRKIKPAFEPEADKEPKPEQDHLVPYLEQELRLGVVRAGLEWRPANFDDLQKALDRGDMQEAQKAWKRWFPGYETASNSADEVLTLQVKNTDRKGVTLFVFINYSGEYKGSVSITTVNEEGNGAAVSVLNEEGAAREKTDDGHYRPLDDLYDCLTSEAEAIDLKVDGYVFPYFRQAVMDKNRNAVGRLWGKLFTRPVAYTTTQKGPQLLRLTAKAVGNGGQQLVAYLRADGCCYVTNQAKELASEAPDLPAADDGSVWLADNDHRVVTLDEFATALSDIIVNARLPWRSECANELKEAIAERNDLQAVRVWTKWFGFANTSCEYSDSCLVLKVNCRESDKRFIVTSIMVIVGRSNPQEITIRTDVIV